jgi:gamma-glutamyl hercynylcysteine S-oxide synthase
MRIKIICFMLLFVPGPANFLLSGQEITYSDKSGLLLKSIDIPGEGRARLPEVPLFSFMINGKKYISEGVPVSMIAGQTLLVFEHGILAGFSKTGDMSAGIEFHNKGNDTIIIENVIPFGGGQAHTYITSAGPWSLTRAMLYRPGYGPVGVILPDNAWEAGYGSFDTERGISLCGLCRRGDVEKGKKYRYETHLYPGGKLLYHFNFDIYDGPWQNGVKKVFQEKFLYDLEDFDNSLYEREDLQWVRYAYVAGLNFAWDRDFYDRDTEQYGLPQYLQEGERLFGGYDIYAMWPTWPRLGLDERNQWDLFRDLPGGLPALEKMSEALHQNGTRFFICYNPWDESSRKENHYDGIAAIIEATQADGVVLDCSGKSNERLQRVADSIREGVIMYSEGMAVPADMPGIVAGRVHDAIYYSPPLNLNKLIKPDFAIFRVLQRCEGDLRREMAISFFNGYGTELNSMGPGRPGSGTDDLRFLGKTSMILRQNSGNFLSQDWTPLLPALADSIWVNKWPLGHKEIYTILSFRPEGFDDILFEVQPDSNRHYISLWHHQEIESIEMEGKHYIPARLMPYDPAHRNTRKEGSPDCIAAFPDILKISDAGHQLKITAALGDKIRIWQSDAAYGMPVRDYPASAEPVGIDGTWLAGERKIIIQLFSGDELIDERIYLADKGKPWLVSEMERTGIDMSKDGMTRIDGGKYSFKAVNNDQFIPYPGPQKATDTIVDDFWLDIYPVTNRQYADFLRESGYRPADTANFLKHWHKDTCPDSLQDHPVVYVSYEDARAYARWAGKRLPTELEWQYAAQPDSGLAWPWGVAFEEGRCNDATGSTTPVDAFPEGASPFGIMDMTGNVWQMTGDKYDNGSHTFIMIKGGSFHKPESSWWYIQGGPQPPGRQQMLLLVSPGFDRSSTVGFRCAADI